MAPLSKPTLPSILVKVGVPIIALGAILFVVDRFFGEYKREARAALILIGVILIVVTLIWLLIWVIRRILTSLSAARARRRAALAAAPRPGATLREEQELDALQNQLNRAVRVLQESKLARGRRRDEALYALPWILILGPPESGKTTMLKASGLDFPYTTAEGTKSRKGSNIPGCDFWFCREAVLLDLAGRLVGDPEESEIFKGFLNQLKRARRLIPLEGVVITVPLADILRSTPEHLEDVANRLRENLDEMVRHLGIRFPVYVVFTKCDQLPGFEEFFGRFRSRDRAQVWGATVSREQRGRLPADQVFLQEFDRLAESLGTYRLPLLATEKDRSRLPHVFTFPLRFAGARERISEFIGALLRSTPYAERPIFRGFYLTSSNPAPTREHPQVQNQTWDPLIPVSPKVDESGETAKPYFLDNLFRRIIFADRSLAKASLDTRLRRRLWQDVVLSASILISVILAGGMIISFIGNLRLIESTLVALHPVSPPGWNARRTEDLMDLESLRKKVVELETYDSARPLRLRFGLYTGEKLSQAARHVYYNRLRETFIKPAATALLKKLSTGSLRSWDASQYDEYYTYLKAYLMMTDPAHSESSFLLNALDGDWKLLVPRNAQAASLASMHLQFYAEHLAPEESDLLVLRDPRDETTVGRVRAILCQSPAEERIYTRLKNEGISRFQPFTLAQATGGKSLEFLQSSYSVPGIFTEAGWNNYFKEAASNASKRETRDDWVLGGCSVALSGTAVNYEEKVKDRYLAEYADQWLKFLEGISVNPFLDVGEARRALDAFSQQDSAISRLLMNVARNTMLTKDPEKRTGITRMVDGALATLGLAQVDRNELIKVVGDEFRPLHELVTSLDGKTPSPSARYVLALAKLNTVLQSLFAGAMQWDQVKEYVSKISRSTSGDEFHEAFAMTSEVKQLCNTRSTRPIGRLLDEPLSHSWSAILRDVGYQLDGLWKSRIADGFRNEVQTRYPFNPAGSGVPLSVLSDYLRTGEGKLWVFLNGELQMFLTPVENRWAPKQLLGAQVAFAPDFLDFMEKANAVRRGIFGAGAEPAVAFTLKPEPYPGIKESRLEIDGQSLVYFNAQASPQSFRWPGQPGPPQARISLSITNSEERPSTPTIEGEWSLFKLLGLGHVDTRSQIQSTVTWTLNSSDGRKFELRYLLQSRNAPNPFEADFFSRLRCPDRATAVSSRSAPYSDTR